MSNIKEENLINTLPVKDLYDHIESARCPCKPRVLEDGCLIVHNSFDRRELFEPDRVLTFAEHIEKAVIIFKRFFIRLVKQLRSR